MYQLLQPLDAKIYHVGSLAVFWRCRLLAIALFVCRCQITHHIDYRINIVKLIVKLFCLDLALCLRQFRTPCLLCGVGDIGCDDESLHVVMESDAVYGGLRDGGQ